MKGSSRPGTAKKNTLGSPKRARTTAQGRDLDLPQLCDAIQEAVARQKEMEGRGKYVEAEAFKRRAKGLREQLEDRQMEEFRGKHEKELRELEEAHLAEMNLFALDWQKRIEEFNGEIERTMEELRERHQQQTSEVEGEAELERRFHESPKLLELRKVEQELGKQESYIEAHRVQQKANKLEKEELERHRKGGSAKRRQQLSNLRARQEGELEAMKMRIQSQVEERERQRMREEEILRHKYDNILRETEFEQNQELNGLNKKVRLGQLQKKSKVGMFSLSKPE